MSHKHIVLCSFVYKWIAMLSKLKRKLTRWMRELLHGHFWTEITKNWTEQKNVLTTMICAFQSHACAQTQTCHTRVVNEVDVKVCGARNKKCAIVQKGLTNWRCVYRSIVRACQAIWLNTWMNTQWEQNTIDRVYWYVFSFISIQRKNHSQKENNQHANWMIIVLVVNARAQARL